MSASASSIATIAQGTRRQIPADVTSICFRVTRACNLRCPYCQAPQNSRQLSISELFDALSYFARNGTTHIKFTGGEPFIYHGILSLVEKCRALGMEPTVVTNGTKVPPDSLECLRKNRTRIKVSLHGPREIHNRLQGQEVYDDVVATLRMLIGAGIETSVHTLLYRGSELDLTAWTDFLVELGVHKVSLMTFVPRGRGRDFKEEWSFNEAELQDLSQQIDGVAARFRGKIIVRCLDFARKPYVVFETDGSVGWQVSEEIGDEYLYHVPFDSENTTAHRTGDLLQLPTTPTISGVIPIGDADGSRLQQE